MNIYQRKGFRCLHFVDLSAALSDIDACSDAISVFSVDFTSVVDKVGLLEVVSKSLDFPEYFGGNWEALYDCLTDLESFHFKDVVVVLVKNYEELFVAERGVFGKFVSVWLDAAEFWHKYDKTFHLVFCH